MVASHRIAYLVSRYPTVNHTFILREIIGLREEGVDVDVVAIRGVDRPIAALTAVEKSEIGRTVTVLPVGVSFLAAHLFTLFRRPIGYLRGLWLALRMSRWNLVSAVYHLIYFAEAVVAGHVVQRRGITHVHSHFSSTVAYLMARIFSIGYSVTIHGPDEFNDVAGFYMRQKVAGARFIVTISSFARSQVLRSSDPEHWEKVEVCRLGVDPEVFHPSAIRTESNAPVRIIVVGRLAPVKAHQILIGACARVVSRGGDICLHIVGSGPEQDRLQRFVQSRGMQQRVIFEGPRNQDEVLRFYRQSDIFALASFAEGVPVVLMEAMAMELPCIATWVNGIPELITHAESGLLVPAADESRFADALEQLIQNSDLRRRLGSNGRQQVLQHYDLRRNVSSLAGIFARRLHWSSDQSPTSDS